MKKRLIKHQVDNEVISAKEIYEAAARLFQLAFAIDSQDPVASSPSIQKKVRRIIKMLDQEGVRHVFRSLKYDSIAIGVIAEKLKDIFQTTLSESKDKEWQTTQIEAMLGVEKLGRLEEQFVLSASKIKRSGGPYIASTKVCAGYFKLSRGSINENRKSANASKIKDLGEISEYSSIYFSKKYYQKVLAFGLDLAEGTAMIFADEILRHKYSWLKGTNRIFPNEMRAANIADQMNNARRPTRRKVSQPTRDGNKERQMKERAKGQPTPDE